MENCLFTKLKGVVDNNNLEKYGVAEWDIPANTPEYAFMPGLWKNQTLSWDGGVVVKDYQNNILSSPYMLSSVTKNTILKVSAGETGGTLALKDKYKTLSNVTDFSSTGMLKPLKYGNNLESISYWWKGITFQLSPFKQYDPENQNMVTGNISDIADVMLSYGVKTFQISDCPNIEGNLDFVKDLPITGIVIIVRCPNLEGELETMFGSNTNITQLNIPTNKISGTVEGFVDAQRLAGRTQYTNMRCGFAGTGITYNNSPITNIMSLSWTDDSITFVPWTN